MGNDCYFETYSPSTNSYVWSHRQCSCNHGLKGGKENTTGRILFDESGDRRPRYASFDISNCRFKTALSKLAPGKIYLSLPDAVYRSFSWCFCVVHRSDRSGAISSSGYSKDGAEEPKQGFVAKSQDCCDLRLGHFILNLFPSNVFYRWTSRARRVCAELAIGNLYQDL